MNLLKKCSIVLSSLFLSSLMAQTPEQIANILKSKSGETLHNLVLFVQYGTGAFDWLALTPDGKFAAKLDGLNPDGTFRYTILGDPADYGLKFDISLTGVKILTQNSYQPTYDIKEQEIQNASLAITTFISNANVMASPSSIRALKSQNPYFSLVSFIKTDPKKEVKREIFTQQCTQGGYVEISVNSAQTDATINYKDCIENGTTINGIIQMSSYDGYSLNGKYQNFTLITPQYRISIPTATFSMNTNSYDELENFELSIPQSFITYLKQDITVESKNYYLNIRAASATLLYFSIQTDFKASCQSSWSHLTTLNDIQADTYKPCPTGGVVEISNSTSKSQIIFNSDGSIDVVDKINNQNIEHFPNCLSLPSIDTICQ